MDLKRGALSEHQRKVLFPDGWQLARTAEQPSPVSLPGGLLVAQRVALAVPVQTKRAAFEEIGRLIDCTDAGRAAKVAERLWARELLGSTGLGDGVALPHADVAGLRRPVVVFLRLAGAIRYGAADDKPVSIMVALLVPKPASSVHLSLLKGLTQLLKRSGFREDLAHRADAQAVCDCFDRWAGD